MKGLEGRLEGGLEGGLEGDLKGDLKVHLNFDLIQHFKAVGQKQSLKSQTGA